MSFSNYYFFFFIVLAIPTHLAADFAPDNCEKTPFLGECTSLLKSAPEADKKDVQSFAKFALKTTCSNGVTMQEKISSLLKTTSDEFVKKCLTKCSELYLGSTKKLEESIVAFDSKAYKDVQASLTEAIAGSDDCRVSFKEKVEAEDPLGDLNFEFNKLCSISKKLVEMAETN
ncbi:uncharacterized protein LOC122724648 [Manihot esculenta]|uniref:Uncharacterized protein n=1 Tax=Manihot esculenta TaxID=3983 RepID=A0ACB7H9E9_MANES|nr:uncharacterized protein LOC122724648 [Manihot esculenta]KAG8648288.1 hypothetical protein MANES_09G171725v8 [Manihot esculenta]